MSSERDFDEKKVRFLLLFGLKEDFEQEELTSAYRTLAKLNHPDVSRDLTSEMRMAIINEGHRFLSDYVKTRKPAEAGKKFPEDVFYTCYRGAFVTLKQAFEDYFGEGEDTSRVGDLPYLQDKLKEAKKGFSRLVTEMPYNPWVDDAIDKINSINKWLD